MKSGVVLVVSLVATYTGLACAASLPVAIEMPNPAATACGISEPQLESAGRRVLKSSRYQPDPEAGGWLNVRVTITEARRTLCAARLSVQMKAYAKPLPPAADQEPRRRSRVPVVMLCNKNGSYSAPKDRFPLEVESAMERSIMRCLGTLKD